MQYSYPCRIEPDGDGWVASFPDVPEALTGDSDYGETVELATDALVTALSRCYVERRRELPPPGARTPGEVLIRLPALVAGKLALYSTMRRNRITRVELARRLAVSVTTARRIVDPQHRSHIEQVERALRAVGRVLVVDDRAMPERAPQASRAARKLRPGQSPLVGPDHSRDGSRSRVGCGVVPELCA